MLWAWLALTTTTAPSLHLEWRAAEGCPDDAWVLSEVQRLRGEIDVRQLAAGVGLIARVSVTPVDGRWRAEVRTRNRGVPGQRVIDAESCERAAATTAVVLAVALADQQAQPSVAPPAIAAMAEPLPGPTAPSTSLSVAAAVLGRSGPLPAATVHAAVGVGVVRGAVRVELTWFSPAAPQRIDLPAATAQLSMPLSGELAGAVAVIEQAVELDFAAALVGGLVHGQGMGFSGSQGGDAGWLAFEGGAVFRVPLWRGLAARAEGRIGASFLRPQFTIDDAAIYTAPLLTGRAAAGLEWNF